MTNILKNKYFGSIYGLAVCDALGAPFEFKKSGYEVPDEMISKQSYPPGAWTDDTSMALCLAESLIECEGFDPNDQMKRYLRWFKDGYLSSIDRCFGIGQTCLKAIMNYELTGNPNSGSEKPESAGNGSIMRISPAILYYYPDIPKSLDYSSKSSLTTHGTKACLDACRLLGIYIMGALNGHTKDELLSSNFPLFNEHWNQNLPNVEIEEIRLGSYKQKEPPEIMASGYVVKTLECALWAFYKTSNFKDGAKLAVSLGQDADTVGAVYGQLAGAFYGYDNIPNNWINSLQKPELVASIAERLYASNRINN